MVGCRVLTGGKRIMRRLRRTLSILTVLSLLGTAFITGFNTLPVAEASSHREAPLISADPLADGTDLYAFVSPDRANSVTILANFIPLEEPASGPNFFKFDDNVLYQIRFDNNGDGRLDLAIQFRFKTVIGNTDTFLYNTNTIDNLADADWNVKQFMDVTIRVRQGDPANPTFASFVLGTNLPTPPVNIGPRSTPNYETNLAEPAISTIPSGAGNIRVFAGQRDEGFYVDLGSAFDLLGLRPFNSAHLAPLATSKGVDATAGYNVHTIAIQVPTQLLTATGALPTGPTDPNAILGIYSTASRNGTRVLNLDGTKTETGDCFTGAATAPSATCVQVSRLGNPLFNELLIPQGDPTTTGNDKDLYNAQLPATDVNRLNFVRGDTRDVEPVKLINLLYPPLNDAPVRGRNDLVRVFLTGVPGATRYPFQADPNDPTAGLGSAPAEYIRLNAAIPATAPGSENRLGVIAGDNGGYPNGRRVGDDVVDITLRVAAGVLLPGNACAGGTVNCNSAPNNLLGDGVQQNDRPFRATFPYLASPAGGYENPFHGRECAADVISPCPVPSPTPRP